MKIATALKLRELGWPQNKLGPHDAGLTFPTTDELLEALPVSTHLFRHREKGDWRASHDESPYIDKYHESPVEALASLWLELKSKKLL
jgi:hypothetical protein